jgi:glycerophosphoryl diester phosphodiesterase
MKACLLFIAGVCCGPTAMGLEEPPKTEPIRIPVVDRLLEGKLETQPPVIAPEPSAFRLAVRPDGKPLVIAHRGASGYLPEHTLAAYAAAYFMGADVIEPDVVLTKDGVPICSHDLTLDATTDVADKFPGRARADGEHYAIDFTLAEIKTLEKLGREGKVRMRGHTIPTLAEMIEMVQSLNESTGGTVGIIPEPKSPQFHREDGRPIESPLVSTLARFGYTTRDDACMIQCFDLDSLWMMRDDLACDLPLAFVFGEEPANGTLESAATLCDAFGPKFKLLLESESLHAAFATGGAFERFELYPWTFGDVALDARLAFEMGAAGIFIDFPDVGVWAREDSARHPSPLTPGSGRPRTRPSAP